MKPPDFGGRRYGRPTGRRRTAARAGTTRGAAGRKSHGRRRPAVGMEYEEPKFFHVMQYAAAA
ncbi:hypothetical protein, partial [Halorubrum sp. SD626R]|uniref:hypothetical protein n=1 Tax=Halorubrum sp. SD626R TaxID=1419722 RepID=UPI001C40021E